MKKFWNVLGHNSKEMCNAGETILDIGKFRSSIFLSASCLTLSVICNVHIILKLPLEEFPYPWTLD